MRSAFPHSSLHIKVLTFRLYYVRLLLSSGGKGWGVTAGGWRIEVLLTEPFVCAVKMFVKLCSPVAGQPVCEANGASALLGAVGHSESNVPNEAVNLLKIKIDYFPTEPKAVRLLKTRILIESKPSTY